MDQAERLRRIVSEKYSLQNEKPLSARVIAVTSGKGGVGKSNFTLNLAIELSRQGKKTLIFDADLGLSNIEVLFGKSPQYSFIDVLRSRKTILEVLSDGPEGIKFISGGSGIADMIKDNENNIAYIARNFSLLDELFDVILIDTGAGISQTVINFILSSNEVIVVTTPEPTSLTDSYALIKTVKHSGNNIPKLNVIVNRVDDIREGEEVYKKLQSVSSSFLNLNLNLLGHLPYDNLLVKAVKLQTPVLIAYPKSHFTKSLKKAADNLLVSGRNNLNDYNGLSFFKKLVNAFKV